MLAALGKSLLSGRKKKKSKSGKEMSDQILNRSENVEEDRNPVIKPQNSLVPLSIKTTTISTEKLITTKEDSIKDKLLMIKDLLGLQLKFRLSSFSQRMESMREERRKEREKEIEENKQKKKKTPFLSSLPKIGILDSLKNFLLFLAGGFLLNLLLNNFDVLEGIGNIILSITTGIMKVGKFLWNGVIGFITTAYDKYDEFRESVRDIGGDEAVEKFDRLSNLLKTVINGAIIAATIALVSRPFLKKGCLPNIRNPQNLRNFRNINRRNNRINNRRTRSGGQQLNRGPLSGMRESVRNIRNRIPFLNRNVTKGTDILNTNPNTFNQLGKGSGTSGNSGNFFSRLFKRSNVTQGVGGKSGGNFFSNLFKRSNVTQGVGGIPSASTAGKGKGLGRFLKNIKIPGTGVKPGFKLPKIPGLGMLGKSLSKFLGPLFFVIDFGGRKGEGQTNLQAGAGAGAAQAGFFSGSALAAKVLSPLLVTPVPGARILYGVSVFGAGILGSMGLTSVTDTITGANKVGINKSEQDFTNEINKSEQDFTKNIKSIDDLAQDTSYSQGSYGLIADITTLILPVVQEV